VSKYDKWTYYQKHFQKLLQGQKAIDIIAVEPKNQCIRLIEVKDYRANRRLKPSDLINEVVQKVLDTLAGLWGAKINARILAEKQLAIAAAKSQQLRVVLHLEQPLKHSKSRIPKLLILLMLRTNFAKCFVRLIPMLKFLTSIIRQNIYGVYEQIINKKELKTFYEQKVKRSQSDLGHKTI
jgi:Holliday junction resolvase-like predicted endonuclease